MRLLYVIDSLAPGGAERSLAALAPHYRDAGIELDVACLHDRNGLRGELEASGAKVTMFAGDRRRVAWTRFVWQLVRQRRPDLVHTTLFEADLTGRIAARLAGTPVVSSLVNVEYGPEHFANPTVRAWKVRAVHVLDAATARLTVRLHAVSAHVADVMATRLRIERTRIDVVPRGRDPEGLGRRTAPRRATARQGLGVDDETPLIMAVARQDHGKGLDVLVRAAVELRLQVPRAQVIVAGRPGDATTDLLDLVAETGAGDSVRFVGARDDVPELLCAADVFVLPSLREGMPGALLEAMALGAPIVASDIPQIREVVDEACARLVAPSSPASLARALLETLGARRESAWRADQAQHRFAERYTIGRVADQMVRFYERALGE